jgi:hypothetical protein
VSAPPPGLVPEGDEGELLAEAAKRWLWWLRENWGSAYEFGVQADDQRVFLAVRRDDGVALAAEEPAILLRRVRADYHARPMPRDAPSR